MASNKTQTVSQPPLADHDSSVLDLSFAMDCTGSMGSYIHQAQQNVRHIVEEIVSKEKSDIHLSLVEYRDHPPQDSSFVTRVHDFTDSVKKMKGWLDGASASGGGDCPEAVADALHQVLKLSWRDEATKICVFIADAPPHGLNPSGDGFPNGCPDGLDCIQIANQMAEKGITLYMVGCEPSINQYKEFFMALAHLTGGQYVPLGNAQLLAKVIIGGAQEEISLQRLMQEVNIEVQQQAMAFGGAPVDEEEISKKVHAKLASRGEKSVQLQMNQQALPEASAWAQKLSSMSNMADVRKEWVANAPKASPQSFSFGAAPMGMMAPMMAPPAASASLFDGDMGGAPPPPPGGFSFGERSAPPPPGGFSFGGPPPPAPPGDFSFGGPSMPQSAPAPAMDDYSVNAGAIQYEQTSRMVQKAMKQQHLK